tara:strand:+ start:5011 stop:6051 length:1041 start_codon:yes stop_codon:yes gene_type:complete
MRKKMGRSNHRKFGLIPGFMRRSSRPDETDWITLDADTELRPKCSRRKKSRAIWAIRAVGIVMLCGSIPLGLKWANEAIFYNNQEFVLQKLDIQTNGTLSHIRLREIANVSAGMNLMEIDLGSIKDRLEKIPVVEAAVISRAMPDRLNVVVTERKPVAWLSCPPLGIRPGDMERGFLMDKDGIPFRCMDLTESIQVLPVIEAYRMEDPVEGELPEVMGLSGALELVASEGRFPGTEELAIHAIKLRNEWSMQCLYRNGLEVTFALREIDRGLRDLGVILSQSENLNAPLETVNVAVSKNIPVTFAEPLEGSSVSVITQPIGSGVSDKPQSTEDEQQKHLRSILKNG